MAANVINYVYHLVMGRILGPVDYGSLASIFSIFYMVGIIPSSTGFAIVKFISSAKDAKERASIYRSIRRLLWRIGVAGAILIIVLSPLISQFIRLDDKFSVALVGPIFFFSVITLVNQASMQGILKFMGTIGPVIVSSAAKLVIGVLFVLMGFSVAGAVAAVLISSGLSYWVSVKLKGELFSQKSNRKFDTGAFLKYALPVLLQALAFTSIFTVDLILVKHFLPPFEAGLYAALSTLGKIVFFAAMPVTQVMFPIVSGRSSKGEKYKKVFLSSLLVTMLISAGVVLVYYFFPNIAIGLLYGKQYLTAASELIWMGLFMAIYTTSYLLVNFFLSIGRTKIVALPLIISVAQVVGISIWHESILQVIQVSLIAVVVLFLGLVVYLGYSKQLKESYA